MNRCCATTTTTTSFSIKTTITARVVFFFSRGLLFMTGRIHYHSLLSQC
jgi:hypothetical protein